MAWTSHPSNKMFDCLLNGRKPTRLDWKARKQSRIFLSQVGHWRHCKLGVTLAIAALCVVSCVAIDRSGPADENAAVVTLITKLGQSHPEDLRYSRSGRDAYFLPLADSIEPSLGSEVHSFVRPELRKIVATGADAVPTLLAHIDDKEELLVQPDFPFNNANVVIAYVDFTGELPPIRTAEFQELNKRLRADDAHRHKLNVGDLCFFALGQIVNERYLPWQFLTPRSALLTSPSHSAELAKAVRDQWRGLTSARLLEKLSSDLLSPKSIRHHVDAYLRLMFFFPTESPGLVANSVRSQVGASIAPDAGGFVSDLNYDSTQSVTAAIAAVLDHPLLSENTSDAAFLGLACVGQLIRRREFLEKAKAYCESRRGTKWYAAAFDEKLAAISAAAELPPGHALEIKSEQDLSAANVATTAIRCDSLSASAFVSLGRLKELGTLDLVDCAVDTRAWGFICKCPKLRKFSFHQRSFGKTDLSWTAKISDCAGLVELTLSTSQPPPLEFLAGCAGLTHLTSLVLSWGSGVHVGSLEWKCLLECAKLESLHVIRPRLDVRAVDEMKPLQSLLTMRLQGCIGLNDAWISWLLKCSTLRTLSCRALSTRDADLPQNPLTARAVGALGSMTNLQNVELSGFSGVTDEAAAELARNTSLQSLTLDNSVSLTSHVFEPLSKHKFVAFSARDLPVEAFGKVGDFLATQTECLETLELSMASSRLTGNTLRDLLSSIQKCKKLRALVLQRADFSSCLETRLISTSLKDLALPGADLRGVPLKTLLAEVSGLLRLDLSNAQLDSKCCIVDLAVLASLERLVLVGATGVTADEIKTLVAEFPNTKIER